MQLKAIHETFLPDMLRNEFGKEIFKNIETHQHISVKGFAGSSPSVFAAELFCPLPAAGLFAGDRAIAAARPSAPPAAAGT